MIGSWFPAFLFVAAALGLGGILVLLARILGPRRSDPVKDSPYECGEAPWTDARDPFPVKFYLVGVLFLLFDLETVFLIPWGVQGGAMGWEGVAAGALFAGVLGLGLAYAWGKGVLDWGRE